MFTLSLIYILLLKMSVDSLKEVELRQLANTTRFLKSEYLRKVDVVSDHLNTFSLHFKDIDLECEWRLEEFRKKKTILWIIAIYRFVADLVFNVSLLSGSKAILICRFVLDLLIILGVAMMFIPKSAKASKDTLELLNSEAVHKVSNWELIKFKLK